MTSSRLAPHREPPTLTAPGRNRHEQHGAITEADGRHAPGVKHTADPAGLWAQGLWADDAPPDAAPGHSLAADAGRLPESAPPVARRSARAAPSAARSRWARAVPSRQPFRGRYVRAVPVEPTDPVPTRDLAWDAMLRHAAVAASRRAPEQARFPLRWTRSDWLRRQRSLRPGRLLLLLVDISGSMGGTLMALARQVALHSLRDAYVARHRVAMIAFRASAARVLFGPTHQIERIHRSLRALPLGGTTPLAAGLSRARELLAHAASRDPLERQRLLLISDGRANVGSRPGHEAVMAEVAAAAQALSRWSRLRIDFVDTTEPGKDDRPARRLCSALAARRVPLGALDPATAAAALSTWGS